MTTPNIAILSLTFTAASAITANRFITATGVQARARGHTAGVARFDAKVGEDFTADVIGTAMVAAGGAVAIGDAIEVNAEGKAITLNKGLPVARALTAAAADGDLIEVLLIPN